MADTIECWVKQCPWRDREIREEGVWCEYHGTFETLDLPHHGYGYPDPCPGPHRAAAVVIVEDTE